MRIQMSRELAARSTRRVQAILEAQSVMDDLRRQRDLDEAGRRYIAELERREKAAKSFQEILEAELEKRIS